METDAPHYDFSIFICISWCRLSLYCAKKADGIYCFFCSYRNSHLYFYGKKSRPTQPQYTLRDKADYIRSFFGGLIGFYDGVFGPGSGSLLLFVFVKFFGFDFLNASASAKLVNLGTFSAALIFFVPSGNILWTIGGVVAACNIAGSLTGVFLALRYGSGFIRIFFLVLLVFLIGRMGITIVNNYLIN